MRQVFGGAVLVIAGIAAFIEAHSHRPGGYTEAYDRGPDVLYRFRATGLSQTGYDLLRIGAWTLVIVGGLLVVMGLIRYWAQARP